MFALHKSICFFNDDIDDIDDKPYNTLLRLSIVVITTVITLISTDDIVLILNRRIRDAELFLYNRPFQKIKVQLARGLCRFKVKVVIIALLLNNSVYT